MEDQPWGGQRRKTNLEGTQQTLVDTHHCSGIVELSTVVGGTEQSNQLALREELVAVLNDLVGTAYQVHVVLLQESRNDVGPECEADTTIVFTPSRDILVGVRP